MKYIQWFKDIRLSDIAKVGGKTANLGELISQVVPKGIKVPNGFAILADAYWHFLQVNNLQEKIKAELAQGGTFDDLDLLASTGQKIRTMIVQGKMPDDLAQEIKDAYTALSKEYNTTGIDVAVRSSATAEDLPNASFAGQQDTFLGIQGIDDLLAACKKSFASLFTDRAIMYRGQMGFDAFNIALAIAVQKMVRSDKAESGIAFSLDTETGFKDIVVINASYGLGEAVVQGLATPDEYIVFKPTLKKGFRPIIKKQCGSKEMKMVYGAKQSNELEKVVVPEKEQSQFCLQDQEIVSLATMVVTIEDYYSALKKQWMPVDVEWAKDGDDQQIYIVQTRPETVHGKENHNIINHYQLESDQTPRTIVTGQSIGQHIVSGTARVLTSLKELDRVKKGDILITKMTDPDWVPAMKKAVGIITDQGGRTCHAAIVSRELNIPAIVGTGKATQVIKDGQMVTIDCSKGATGSVYEGALKIKKTSITVTDLPKPPVDIMLNLADPDRAFTLSFLPVAGVGLARIEFIISNSIKVHPMALLHPEKVTDKAEQQQIAHLTAAYKNPVDYYVDTLARGIGMIAAAFYPRSVIVRTSDFKTNEYRDLVGGHYFEEQEENPMLGFRGAARYYSPQFQEAFALECKALCTVITDMGLDNVTVMVPFVRTIEEGKRVLAVMDKYDVNKKLAKIIMMCEIPSNVILIDQFSELFDGFSIGSNDLTQLVLGIDRDSHVMNVSFDERDPAVMAMMSQAIEGAQRNKRSIGICGQAPSDYPEVAQFLIQKGISSMSLNPDSVLPFLMRQKKQK